MSRRFVYNHSSVYGWTVYDKKLGFVPAYEACCNLLPPLNRDEFGTVTCESPVMLDSEYDAMRLCMRLNLAEKKSQKSF